MWHRILLVNSFQPALFSPLHHLHSNLCRNEFVCLCVHACPVPLVRVWLIHETEFVCGMPARHSCCMQMRRKEWEWICKSEIKTARGHDYNETQEKIKTNKKKKQAIVQQQMVSGSSRGWQWSGECVWVTECKL